MNANLIKKLGIGVFALAAVVTLSACEEKSDMEKAAEAAEDAAEEMKDRLNIE